MKDLDGFAVDIDVDMRMHLALSVSHQAAKSVKSVLQDVQQLLDILGLSLDTIPVVGGTAERRRDIDLHGHWVSPHSWVGSLVRLRETVAVHRSRTSADPPAPLSSPPQGERLG